MKRVVVLGSTGSIGRQTLEVIRAFPDKLQVVGLAAGTNLELLAAQIRQFHPKMAYCQDWSALKPLLYSLDCCTCSMEEMASHPDVDLVMVGTSGRVGLSPTLAGIAARKSIALANKEVLIMAGGLVIEKAKKAGMKILPVDSEPSAIWQCLQGEKGELSRIILTASGGPFRLQSLEEMAKVKSENALRHPTWKMGRKITIDSATLMNKGLEVIEAHWLFGVPYDQIEVVIHPQSVIHSMVEFADGSIKAQMSPPDMRFPIQYAFSYPERWSNSPLPKFDPVATAKLTFEELRPERFPCFDLAVKAGKQGGTYPAVLSAADEMAVGLFLSQQIGFLEIPKIVEKALECHDSIENPSLQDILEADEWARGFTTSQVPG